MMKKPKHPRLPMPGSVAAELKVGYEDGWTGAFTRHQADGAIPNGTTVVKLKTETIEGDMNPEGTRGTVLGSIDGMLIDPEMSKRFNARFMYWVEWETRPKTAIAVVDRKIAKLS